MTGKPLMHMIVPGRRALGETWSKVTITPNSETGQYDVQKEATTAPADNKPIIVPALGNISIEMADYLLEESREEAKRRARNPNYTESRDYATYLNQLFQDFIARRLAIAQGKSVIGPGGATQRESVPDWLKT